MSILTRLTIGELLDEIINKEGTFSRDEHEFMDNVITKASNNAAEVKERLIIAINDLINEEKEGVVGVLQGLYELFGSCGGVPKKEEST